MGKLLKIFGIILASAILLLAVGIAALVTLVNPNDFKKEIAEAIQQHTGRAIEFSGDLKLSLFPWLGLEAGTIRIGNPEAFGGGDFASIDSAGVHIKLLPLMERDVQVSSVTLNGLKLNLVRNANGQANWDFFPDNAQQATQPDAPAPLDQDGIHDTSVASPLAALLVESIAVNQAAITYTDLQSNSRFELSELNLKTSTIRMGKPVDIALHGALMASTPAVNGNIDLKLTVLLAHDFTRIDLDNMILALDAQGAALPGGALHLRQQGAFAYDLIQQIASIKNLSVSAYDANVSASGTLDLIDNAAFNGKIALQSALRNTLGALGLTIPASATTDPDVLKNVSASFNIIATPERLALTDIKGTLDDTDFSGTLQLKQFARPDIKAVLNIATINLDRYLPPESATEETTGSPSAPSAGKKPAPGPESGIPAETKKALRSLLLDATLTANSLTVKKITLSDMNIKATAKDGLIRISPCSANVFEGRYDADITADLRNTATRSAASLNIKDIKLAPLTTSLTGERQADGTANFQTSLTATGETWPDVSGTLDGTGSFAVTNGAVYGFQIIPDTAKAHLKGSDADAVDENARKQTFDRLSGSYTARAGRIANNDLKLISPNLNAAGEGYVDLRRDKIDYKAIIRVTGLPSIPVTVTGTLANPRYGLDAGAFLQNTLKGVQNLLPIPGLFDSGSGNSNGTDKKPQTPIEQLGKGLQLLFK